VSEPSPCSVEPVFLAAASFSVRTASRHPGPDWKLVGRDDLHRQSVEADIHNERSLLAICAWSLLIYPPGCAVHGCQERLSSNSNSALVLQAPVAINISLQLLIAHIRKVVHALALNAIEAAPKARPVLPAPQPTSIADPMLATERKGRRL
jgi:hypothetical protein